jgi:WD40 repeat protein
VLEFVNSDTGSVRIHLDTKARIADINFVDNDRLLAISTFKPNVQFRDVATGELTHTVELPRADLFDMQPTGDGKMLFMSQRGYLHALDVATMKLTALPTSQTQARVIFPNHDGSLFVTGQFSGEVQLWETASRKLRHNMVAHRETVSNVTISTDGAFIASCAGDAILLWDTATGTLLMTLRELEVSDTQPSIPSYLKFIESNTKLVVGYSSGKMEVYDLQALDAAVAANTRNPSDIATSAGVTPPPPDPTTNAAEMRRWIMRVGKAFTGGEQNRDQDKVPQDK